MAEEGLSERDAGAGTSGPTIEIVIPVHNEAIIAEASVRALRSYLDARFPYATVVTVADGGSTDGTWDVAARVAAEVPGVRAVHLDRRGRGRALRTVWSTSDADVVACMDVDLSTDLDAVAPLVAPLVSGHSDIAIGSRLARGAHVARGAKPEPLSRSYELLVRAATGKRFTDAQPGFTAARTDVIRALLPLVEDDDWFFDTEVLLLAERRGLRIHEVPVDWAQDLDPSREILATSVADLKGLWRISRQALTGGSSAGGVCERSGREEITSRFLTIGGISTAAYLLLLLILQPEVGLLGANAIALTLAAVGNAAAHRGLLSTLAPPADDDPSPEAAPAARNRLRRWAALRRGEACQVGRAAVIAWATGLALSSLALLAAAAVWRSVFLGLVAVLGASAAVSAARFMTLRAVMYQHHLDTLDQPVLAPPGPVAAMGTPAERGAEPSRTPRQSTAVQTRRSR